MSDNDGLRLTPRRTFKSEGFSPAFMNCPVPEGTAYFPNSHPRRHHSAQGTPYNDNEALQRPIPSKPQRFNWTSDEASKVIRDLQSVHQACQTLVKMPSRPRSYTEKGQNSNRSASQQPPQVTFRPNSPWLPRLKFPRHIFPIKKKFRL